MSDFHVEQQEAFTVLGIQKELTSNYTDFAGLAAEKQAFWQIINENGQLERLKMLAISDELFFVNEAVDNKMMYYVGVRADKMDSKADRLIQFPVGEYVVVLSQWDDTYSLSESVINETFGSVLGQVSGYAYVGGPNGVSITGSGDNLNAKMFVPVVQQ
ncbi:transcriptional regulator [Weissella paramesenteroides]|uniref:effector binding domain-containing protein n=1 Tax=Weissella paramesenteroides TaxID=1249 RepID=UPI00123A511A|nr:effector binding domain-containing protein [Weissella paramesenteroides]KAA8440897.1 transcriptional regulator [Weissella paramesenteroides]KAA8441857.1 transcriptional regulator [Weissella paramesenteroides]KAA8443328.1 transcriptional regulator [Weissella paramesenteroides]KAA8447617.1 transcriptional regulator [Weissella paramesenteroides]KAA8449780.1 transcriptional regulator [Weissella paramesenteroides]